LPLIQEKSRQREIQKKQISHLRDIKSKEAKIGDHLIQTVSGARAIIAYKAISFEADIDFALSELELSRNLKIFYPRIIGRDLEFVQAISWNTGKFSVPEPVGTHTTSLESTDFCIVPGLGFNRRGYRLGRGGGFYDRALDGFPAEKILGVSFSEVFPVDFQEEPHDIRAGRLITDKEVIFFENWES